MNRNKPHLAALFVVTSCLVGQVAAEDKAGKPADGGFEAAPTAEQVQESILKGEAAAEDYRKLAAQLIALGLHQEAYDLLAQNLKKNPKDVETRFLMGLALIDLDRPDEAIPILENLIKQNPKLPRVRLELARAYAANSQFEQARAEFRAVKALNPPTAVGENIDKFLAALDAQKFWSARVSVGFVHDDNVNAGPGSSSILAFGVPFTLDNASLPRHDSGWSVAASLNHVYPRSRRFAWQSTAAYSRTDYRKISEFDSDNVSISTGPSWRLPKAVVSLPLVYDYMRLDGDRYSGAWGLAPQAQYPLDNRMTLDGGVVLQTREYYNTATATTRSDRNGGVISANAGLRYSLDETSFVQVGYRLTREDTRKAYLDFTGHSVFATYFKGLPHGLTLVVQPSVARNAYDEKEAAFPEAKRKDVIYTLNINLAKELNKKGLSLALGYTYTKSDSSLALYSYDRNQVTLQLVGVF
jgi:tetratricopeptide (TPR) repeat protein